MEWEVFTQLIIGFFVLTCIIILLQLFSFETGFIITFILAIFTIAVSIFFFVESNRVFGTMQEKLTLILRGAENLKVNPKRVERFKSFKDIISPRRLYNEQRNRL